jgi:hypothetical protein
MPHAAGVVRDSHTIDGTPFSSQEAKRFVGIELDLAMAGRSEFKCLRGGASI